MKYLPYIINTYLHNLGDWFLPQSCFLCGDVSYQPLCQACLADLPYQQTACSRCAYPLVSSDNSCKNCQRHPVVFEEAKTVFAYEYPINKLIQAAKYHQNLAILRLLGQLMAQHIALETVPDVLIPVPLDIKGLRRRGYNQALELAKVMARFHHLPVDYAAVQCTQKKHNQSKLSDKERRENVKGIFKIKRVKSHWQRIVLVDDVITTGATANELAQVFLATKIQRVEVWCCARRS
jgi:ComF family protein